MTRPKHSRGLAQTNAAQARRTADSGISRDPAQRALARSEGDLGRNWAKVLAARPAIWAVCAITSALAPDDRRASAVCAQDRPRTAARLARDWPHRQGRTEPSHAAPIRFTAAQDGSAGRDALIRELPIVGAGRLFHWPSRPRPKGPLGLSEWRI